MDLRNIAIIAHVDHGKTTLVDAMLRQSHTKMKKEVDEADLIMDSNELERERGITIFSKNASIRYHDTKINIIDTPGHADFGGEVERVLKMADGALLLIDAKDGPMPQTRFVLKQALKMKLKIIVVVNKIDIAEARPDWVLGKTFDLFMELGADDSSVNFPIVYASAKNGVAGLKPDISSMKDISPLFDEIVKEIPAPSGDPNEPFQMLVTTIGYNSFQGRIATGRIHNGKIKAGQEVMHINREGVQKKYKLTSLITFEGLERVNATEVSAGDIVAISGIPDVTIGETIADPANPKALPLLSIEEPTIKMTFNINTSPFGGKEGTFKTGSQLKARLYRELETDVALKIEEVGGKWIVSGRGELHLAILIERMRREGYEFEVGRPHAITKTVDGVKMTPWEKVYIEVPDEFAGTVIQNMNKRHSEMVDMKSENNVTYLEFNIATKNLFGMRGDLLTDTRGLGIINNTFLEFRKDDGITLTRDHGSLTAFETGITRLYGLVNVQERGIMFVGPNENVYKGEVVGQNSREEDIEVNVCKEKKLSNMRSKGDGPQGHFNTPKKMSLEEALEYIDDTELVEITPKNIRVRKIILNPVEARRQSKLLKK
ncbi:MAG TPA: translational GTPase TypA [Candidatus Saccharimonadales bacterium]|nr:translational GTPase TypA [Candidatus Saccharimonadales bacterium]